MTENPFDPKYGLVAAVSATVGAILLKLIDRTFQNHDRGTSEATDLRKELRDENKELKTELQRAIDALDAWKEKYFKLLQENGEMRAKVAQLEERLREMLAEEEKAS